MPGEITIIHETTTVIVTPDPPPAEDPAETAAVEELYRFRRAHGYGKMFGHAMSQLLGFDPATARDREREEFFGDRPPITRR